MSTRLKGIFVPVVTPVDAQGHLDFHALEQLIERLIRHGVHGVLLMGTTGEGLSLSLRQRVALMEKGVQSVRGRVPVLASIAHTGFQDVLYLAEQAREQGIEGCLVHVPPHYPLEARDVEHYFLRLADASPLPLLLYHIPPVARTSIPVEVVERLSHHPRIIGIKDSEPDTERQINEIRHFREREDFVHFVGSARLLRWALEQGSRGGILAVANLVPSLCVELYRAVCEQHDPTRAHTLQEHMDRVSALYAGGRTPAQAIATLKALLHLEGLCSPEVLPPLLPLSREEQERLRGAWSELSMRSP